MKTRTYDIYESLPEPGAVRILDQVQSMTARDALVAYAERTLIPDTEEFILSSGTQRWAGIKSRVGPESTIVKARVSDQQLPSELVDTEAYWDDPVETQKLWDMGYRPCQAKDLKRFDLVIYRQTDLFGLNPVGPTKVAEVRSIVRHEDGFTIKVEHSGGDTEEDECAEVWRKVP